MKHWNETGDEEVFDDVAVEDVDFFGVGLDHRHRIEGDNVEVFEELL